MANARETIRPAGDRIAKIAVVAAIHTWLDQDAVAHLGRIHLRQQVLGGGVDSRYRHVSKRRLPGIAAGIVGKDVDRSEEHTSELQSLMSISYAVFCLKKKKNN